jgi:hypothetical protein
MFLHLPIAIAAMLSPITVSDTVPRFDVAKECRFETASTSDFDKCAQDEAAALQQLRMEWSQFASTDRAACTGDATIGGVESYVDLLTCLELAKELRDEENSARGPAKAESQSMPQESLKMRAGDGPNTIGQEAKRGQLVPRLTRRGRQSD